MKNFTKANLKTGDFILDRGGRIGLVDTRKDNIMYISGGDGWNPISIFTDDLICNSYVNDYSIMKVYRSDFCRSMFEVKKAFRSLSCNIVYDREKAEKEKVEEMTLEEVCKALGKNIKIVKG